MPSVYKLDQLFMDIAYRVSYMSHDTDKQVGAIIIKDGNILSIGYNGMPSGMSNNCKDNKGSTNKEVIHAEANAICKLARSTGSSEGATLYSTLSPCIDCAKLILQSGIKQVVYAEGYHIDEGTQLLINQLGKDKVKHASSTSISPRENKES